MPFDFKMLHGCRQYIVWFRLLTIDLYEHVIHNGILLGHPCMLSTALKLTVAIQSMYIYIYIYMYYGRQTSYIGYIWEWRCFDIKTISRWARITCLCAHHLPLWWYHATPGPKSKCLIEYMYINQVFHDNVCGVGGGVGSGKWGWWAGWMQAYLDFFYQTWIFKKSLRTRVTIWVASDVMSTEKTGYHVFLLIIFLVSVQQLVISCTLLLIESIKTTSIGRC